MTATGRIVNEPHAVYHGEHDKPAFGSGAIKTYVTDPELFYHQYVKGDITRPESSRAMVIGSAVDEWLLEDRNRIKIAKAKTASSQIFKDESDLHPDLYVVTESEYATISETVATGQQDDDLLELLVCGKAQVTYRHDYGPFYLQARVDFEVAASLIPERVAQNLELPIHDMDRLLVDLKTCASLYGMGGFTRVAMRSPLHYPIQQALYQLIVNKVTGIDIAKAPFRFFAVAKDGTGSKWVNLFDYSMTANNRVADAIGQIKHRYLSGTWDEFEQRSVTVLVPETYLQWTD